MTWSSGSTSSLARAAWGLIAGVLLTGCHTARTPPPPVPAYADIGVLVRHNPGWASVSQYDAMLARLKDAIRQASSGGVPGTPLSLPPQTGLDLPGEAFTMPADAVAQEERQLTEQTQAQIARLRRRRETARQQQLDLQERVWQREALLRYGQAVQAARDQYTQRYNAAFAADDVRRVNLTLQISALTKTVENWKLSTLPRPLFDQASSSLAEKRGQLVRLEAERGALTGALRAQRDAALVRAATEREAYVRTQRVRWEATLRAQDEAVLAAQQAQLARQTALLFRQERALAAGTVTAAGPTGALALPPGPARPARPARNLEDAAQRLQLQRDRWIAFLYNDTRSAALDAARQRGWVVNFDPSHRGGNDVTGQLAALLSEGVWKS